MPEFMELFYSFLHNLMIHQGDIKESNKYILNQKNNQIFMLNAYALNTIEF
jgi:hypothetical protein